MWTPKNCAECKPADMSCQISVQCKRQRRKKIKNNKLKEDDTNESND